MRRLTFGPQCVMPSAGLSMATSLLHAQAPQAGAPAAPAGRAGQMQLGFNVARENIPHGR